MIQETKRLFRRLTPLEMATRELADAELLLLEARSAVEYARSVVMFNSERIVRLREYITEQNTQ